MRIVDIIYTFVMILLITSKEGYQVAWGETTDPDKRKSLSKIWHFLGFLTRATILVVLVIQYWANYKLITLLLLIYLNFAYTLYDGWIALRLGESFWYEGKTAETDKIFSQKVQTIFKIILLVLTICYTVYYCKIKGYGNL